MEKCDLMVECSGDVHLAAAAVEKAFQAGLRVVTMNTEFHVTVGSFYAQRGYLTEAEGDQPGCLAALHREITGMGFQPWVYGNIKGFLNHTPTRPDMEYWARQQGISLTQVTSFTDGTKLQMEQAFIGNALGADILCPGLAGPTGLSLREGGDSLGERAKAHGKPIADYLLNPALPPGVFIVASHDHVPAAVLKYLKLGEGPFYTLLRPYHLCHLEMPRTLLNVVQGEPPLLNNGPRPTLGIVAIAKRAIPQGTLIRHAIGGGWLRGEAWRIADMAGAAPLGLLGGARCRRALPAGAIVTLDDIELPDTVATRAWLTMRART